LACDSVRTLVTKCQRAALAGGVIIYPVTDFLTGYVVSADAGLVGDPGLKASRHSTGGDLSVFETSLGAGPPLHVHDREDECFYVLIAVPGGIEDYFREINAAPSDARRRRIGERYGIRVWPPGSTRQPAVRHRPATPSARSRGGSSPGRQPVHELASGSRLDTAGPRRSRTA
jgi:hypothetical protein